MHEVITVIRKSPAMEVRNNLDELLNEVRYRGDRIVITKAGKPIAALVDYRLFERIRRMDREKPSPTNSPRCARGLTVMPRSRRLTRW